MAKKKVVQETKVIAKMEAASVPALGGQVDAWGMEELNAGDIIMPKLLLMQGLSKLVTAGEANQGEIANSLTKEVLGGITNIKAKTCTDVEVVCFKAFKTWLEFDKVEGEWVYRKQYPMDATNVDLAQEETVNGVEIRRDRCLNYYVLLPKEIAAGSALPYVVSFRRTSMQAGKKIASATTRWKALGAANPICHKTFKLTVIQKTKDDKNYWAFDVNEGTPVNAEAQAECKKWFNALQKMSVKIDDSDLKETDPVEAASGPAEY